MIGADIVCLSEEPYNKRQARYGAKIFRPGEKRALQLFEPGLQIAVAWSVKESAYKCCSRKTNAPFIPGDYCIGEISKGPSVIPPGAQRMFNGFGFHGLVHFISSVTTPAGVVTAKSILGAGFVFTIAAAAPEEIENVYWRVGKIHSPGYPEQSRLVRENMIRDLQRRRHIASNAVYAFSPAGTAPELYVDGQKHDLQISFSHDRCFIAHAYLLP